MNIFLHELKANRKSIIIWSVSLALIVIFSCRFIHLLQRMRMHFPKCCQVILRQSEMH